jgi:hypothetical protein
METKINYGNAAADQISKVVAFINREVFCCQSSLVTELFKRDIFSEDDIINLYSNICPICSIKLHKTQYDCRICGWDKYDNRQEIFEWYSISSWLAKKLKQLGEPVINNGFG